MRITPCGAAGGEVTGSAYLVESGSAQFLIDCGLFQGGRRSEALNVCPAQSSVPTLAAVLLTHAHLDHVGRLPLLYQAGFRGPVLGTPATLELAALILRDAARVQLFDVERKNRRLERAGKPAARPLYTPDEVEQTLRLLRPVPYKTPVPIGLGIEAVWQEAGHMLGSASILVTASGRKVAFSGDLGPLHAPILREFEPFADADTVFLESTYGDREHRSFSQTVREFEGIVEEAARDGGRMLVPTFAVGRAQLLTVLLAEMFRKGRVTPFPVFLDSPMAIEATKVLHRHPELFDSEMHEFLKNGNLEDDLRTLRCTATAEESRQINQTRGACFVMAGAGMCNAGRILHHLRHNLWKPDTHVIIVGFQSRDSLGRRLIEGAREVRIFGEPVQVRAKIHTLGGFSAHAGQSDLLRWLAPVAHRHPRILLTHGEDNARSALATKIRDQFGLDAALPALNVPIDL